MGPFHLTSRGGEVHELNTQSHGRCLEGVVRVRVHVHEEEVAVGGERPVLGRDHGLGGVAGVADVDHGLEAEHAREGALLLRGLGGVDGGDGGLEDRERGLELRERADARLLDARDHVLLDHVDHGERLHLDGAGVVVQEHLLARRELRLGEDVLLAEELDVLVRGEDLDGVDARVDAPDAALAGLLRPGLVVAVTIEDSTFVLGVELARDVGGVLARLDAVGDGLERVGGDGVEDGVHHRHVLGRADGAVLEASAAVRERRGAVAVLGRHGERGEVAKALDAEREGLGARVVLSRGAAGERVEVVGHVVTEVGRDDGRRGLARAEAEVVARRGDGHAHEVAVDVDGADDG
mmetsp:Transcript_20106/g.46575  ORF Transcript_20106/g.46575 Transcript_20106/m.46575 type:complete len:351 (+) Transcript_20106:250-1302(+)